ncbi:MAG: 2-amino-4-hydroxy-6-hydroxymethyldihydropteridine diphosphokinase [Alistipes sp.]|nr:2-amino-4-hydroxy-6-hydroxymethyldihydropteridine diphosphokinase [Alistipes sp.]
MSRRAIILGGGNVGNVEERLLAAERLIGERIGAVVGRSTMHTSEAWGFDAARFTNCAFAVESHLEAEEMIDRLLDIECELGRDRRSEYREKVLRGEAYASRTIDLDIMLLGEECIVTPHLQIPHPKLLVREFAMTPTAEVLGTTTEELEKIVKKIIER